MPIQTVHPAVMLISLAILGTLLFFALRGEPWIAAPAVILIICVCSWSLRRRKAALDRNHSKSRKYS
jgi:hypothetical protein